MRVLITGGTGFIGHVLSRRLLDAGHELTVLSRQPDAVARRCDPRAIALGDLAALTADDTFDAVINLAGAPIADARWSPRRKQVLWDSRVTLTERLVDYIERVRVRPAVLVSGSAVGYYGNCGDRVLDESSDFTDDYSHRLCAGWERAASRAATLGVRVCILRTGLVIGRDGGFLQRLLPPFRLGLGGRIGDGRQWMSWVHRNDIIRMVERLLSDTDLEGVFNGTAPHPVTNQELTRVLARQLKRPALLPLPELVLRAALGELADLMLGGQRAVPRRFLEAGFDFEFDTVEAALAEALAS